MADIVIVGCGDIGGRLGRLLQADGHRVTGVRRRPDDSAGFPVVAADAARPSSLVSLPEACDLVCYMASPRFGDADSYRAVFEHGVANVLARYPAAPWVFVSSTGVYAQQGGQWVDEDSAAEPADATRSVLRRAEQMVLSHRPGNVVVRLSGIYGPGRERLLELARAGTPARREPPSYTNRIHQDDCAGVLRFLIDKRLGGEPLDALYLASDDDPAPAWDVMTWLASRLGLPEPPAEEAPADAPRNKRCSNRRLRGLGYTFLYPTYREGYGALIAASGEGAQA
jgi:nucleoside-diphosphate-sugar epimerase